MDMMKNERKEWLKSLSEKSEQSSLNDMAWCFVAFGVASLVAVGIVELVLWIG